jgi:hypothetical protein
MSSRTGHSEHFRVVTPLSKSAFQSRVSPTLFYALPFSAADRTALFKLIGLS